ncbi:hypothetical protein BDY19DRAFT_1053255 [Irpex rosettiformis]|uniref:Uncharacterized protein n=1 Tax=Irpex rosettiformis TaxID=378272 RepID=A0ACB8UHQ4_9APHY|nr:hypothetical protein BDY19DRAFT_1053255 [Irpex rosettiformis]
MSANIPNVLSNNLASSASFLNLHYDILVLLASHLRRSDLLSLMQVCRSLYAALVPHLLRSHPIILRTNQLLSFSEFVLTDAPMRFVYLQRLSIGISYVWSKRIADTLRDVLRYSTHLEELCILDCGCLEGYPEVASAIAALTCIRTLTLRYPTQAARSLILQMCSRVTRVEISFSKVPRHYMDPVELLVNCRDSLMTLCMSLPRYSQVRLGIQYMALTRLVLKCHRAMQASPLLYHYPNVRHFTITMCEGHCGHGGFHPKYIRRDDVKIEEMRMVNTLDRTYSWGSLDILRGDVHSIYHLALNCPVQRLELVDVGTADISRFDKVMSDIRPSALEVETNSMESDLGGLSTFMQHMPMELHSLTITTTSDEVTGDLQTSMCNVFSVRLASLSYFCLRRRRRSLRSREEVDEWAKMDLEAHARRFAQVNPSLRFISFESSDPDEISAWQVTHGSHYYTDGVVLSALSAHDARQLISEHCL